ncbi:MAG: glucose-1-phosphate adenylyltransferase [Chloroflexi bacterium]|nr:glucose-1-phosphate adenylyltransferase [Chloroflexota bacterium]
MILAGGSGERLSLLVAERAKPAVPFAGRYRIIDFTLSNCVNSGIFRVAVLTQYNPRSLVDHLGIGRPWDLDRASGGLTVLQPYLSRTRKGWYLGTADAIYQNLYYVEDNRVDQVVILGGDHIYTMRYDYMVAAHRQKNADVTVGVIEVKPEDAGRMGTVVTDRNDRIVGFEEKVENPKTNLASMGIYVFNKQTLIDCLEEDSKLASSKHDFGRDILPRNLEKCKIFAYHFHGYWRDVGTVEAYWQANMDLIVDLPDFNLYDPENTVRTVYLDAPPAKAGPNARISRSLISHGCIINGRVENSVLSPGVYVEEGASVVDSVIFDEATIDRHSAANRAIVDKYAWIGEGAIVGAGDDLTPSFDEPDHLHSGITLVGKGARVPAGTTVGRNCKIGCWVEPGDYAGNVVPSGGCIESKKARRHRV